MNLLAFQSLCRHVSQSLAADDVDALGESRPTPIQGETFQLLWQPEGRSAVLLTYLGRVSDEHARQVYEQLLLVQLSGWRAAHRHGADRGRAARQNGHAQRQRHEKFHQLCHRGRRSRAQLDLQ